MYRLAGQNAVNAALEILHTIDTTTRRSEGRQSLTTSTNSAIITLLRFLFLNTPTDNLDQGSSRDLRHTDPKVWGAAALLEAAATQGNNDAVFLLAEMNFYGNWTYPRNYSRAFELYESLASTTGNNTAQYMLGFMYATGIGDAVERDQGKALLYHTFAALGGNIRSQMTLAFRRHMGIGTPRDCDQAVYYYKQVADRAMDYYRSGPPGGRTLPRDSYHWADEEGGVYGEGASVSASPTSSLAGTDASMEDVVEYLDLLAKKGDIKAIFSLGKMYYDGTRHFPRNVNRAMRYFALVAKHYWGKNGKVLANHPAGIERVAAKAAAHLGHVYLRGEDVPQDFDKALMWFNRSKESGDPMALHYLGLMHLEGLGVPKDAVQAASYFKAAADKDHPLAETQLGIMFLDQGDIPTASQYLELAARYGGISSFYYLAEISDWGLGRERQCGVAAAYYKVVAEKVEGLHSAFAEANEAYEHGDYETALVASMMAAEQGYESAQANVAYLLDEQRSLLPLNRLGRILGKSERPSILHNAALALVYWTRSSRQANTDSLLKMGDYYLKGLGTEPSISKALACYQSAAEGHRSAQALWNLGWMHENGNGVDQDFHMAKRYYDLALETSDEAYLPVKLSLFKLRIRSFWNKITGGSAHSIEPEPKEKQLRTFKEWITAFVSYDDDYDESEYYDTRYRDETDPFGLSDDNREHQLNQRSEGDQQYYDEDYDLEGDLIEMFIIFGLVILLGVLIFMRNQRALNRNRQRDQNQGAPNNQQQANNGPDGNAVEAGVEGNRGNGEGDANGPRYFPQPGDPDYAAYLAGAIGR